MTVDLQRWRNTAPQAVPLLSIVVPYKDYPVADLAQELIGQAEQQSLPVELVFADDGSSEHKHAADLRQHFERAAIACTLLVSSRNVGRAAIRNRLAQEARGPYLLFLDADMLPDSDDFLRRYLEHALQGKLDIVCGGRSYLRLTSCREDRRLYRYFSQVTECVGAGVRNRHPLWYLLTNNLMVRRSLLLEHPYNERYHGWGFEDADWALRLRHAHALHIDNTASHMDLPSEQEMLEKFDDSRANFARIRRDVPEFRRLAVHRAASLLVWQPVPSRWLRWMTRRLVLARWLPMRVRFLSVQGYRAATYTAVLRAEMLGHPLR